MEDQKYTVLKLNYKNTMTEMDKINQLMAKYFAGEISQEEMNQLGDWLESSAENKKLFNDLQKEWSNLELKSSSTDRIRVLSKVKERIKSEEKEVLVRKIAFNSWYRRAASIVVVIALSTLMWYQIQEPFSTLNTLGYEVENCDAGDQKEVLLADGSHIFLNGDSRVKYKKELAGSLRNITLQGEAFFDIERDEQKPFVVYLNDAEVKVLGTSFNIKAYPEDEKVETSVLTGKVVFNHVHGILKKKRENMFLIPGQKGIINHDSNSFDQLQVDNELDIAWMKRKLHFINTPLSEITKSLYRMYGVKFKLTDGSLKDLKITASFENEKLEEVIKILEMTSEFSYKMETNLVTIGKKDEF